MNNYGILFDLDGTLVNSLADICGNLNTVRESFGLKKVPHLELARFIGKGAEYLVRGGLPELTPEQIPDAILRYRDTYLANPFLEGGSIYPGVRETLEELRRRYPGIRLAVATNKLTAVAIKTVEHYLPGFKFDVINGPDNVSRKKPDPAHLLETMALLGLVPERTWFLGDDPVDAECAKAAGVTFFGAGYGFGGVQAGKGSQLLNFRELLEKLPPVAV